ncbi:cytospin-A-like protein [Lates japonicus]|uniref:Cytospin-A-like protein n=1 Tax=Lates japonicus TaxID=270547 RepID=A0AAD3NII7_LATJO|nr:cytospin-A-like protein [Lates japonicus]
MGNFSSKDSHGPTGVHGESFHTPPASPQGDVPALMPGVPQLHPTSSQPSLAAPVSPPPPVPFITSIGRKSHPSTTTSPTTPSTSSPAPDWRTHPPVSSNSSTTGPGVSPVHNKPGTGTVKGQVTLGRNGGPPTSTPRTPVSQGKTVAVSPTKSPSSLCSASPLVGSSSGQNWRERDSGLSQSLLPGHEAGDSHGEELEKLLEEYCFGKTRLKRALYLEAVRMSFACGHWSDEGLSSDDFSPPRRCTPFFVIITSPAPTDPSHHSSLPSDGIPTIANLPSAGGLRFRLASGEYRWQTMFEGWRRRAGGRSSSGTKLERSWPLARQKADWQLVSLRG